VGRRHRPQNFYMLGSMASRSDRAWCGAGATGPPAYLRSKGDGSLLMQLGSLSTIATLREEPHHGGDDNGIYQITARSRTPGATVADIVAIAVASGLTHSSWAADEDDFERLIEASMSAAGPALDRVRIDDKPGTGTTARSRAKSGALHARMGVREPL